jgi:hypothetical protein
MQVQVMTAPKNTADAKTAAKHIDWKNSSDRKWLMNHLHWAMNNEQMVFLVPSS